MEGVLMENPYQSLVNRHLAYIRVQLDAARVVLDKGGVDRALFVQSHLVAALQFLCETYKLYIKELGTHYGLVQVETLNSAQELYAALNTAGKKANEVDELIALEQSGQSWWNNLLQQYDNRLKVQGQNRPNQKNSVNIVPSVDMDALQGPQNLTVNQLSEWMRHLSQILDRHRESMTEF